MPPLPSTDESLFQQLDQGGIAPETVDSAKATALLNEPFSFDNMSPESIAAAHSNMNARLHPFWSSALPGRPVRIDIKTDEDPGDGQEPLCSFTFDTDFQGHFSKRLVIPWERLCTDASSIARVFGVAERNKGWTLRISAKLLTCEGDDDGEVTTSSCQREVITPVTSDGGLRVVCDLDDTVKRTDVLSGLRTVIRSVLLKSFLTLRNVFCAPLEGVCVSGFDDLFRQLARKGVHFHFVVRSHVLILLRNSRILQLNYTTSLPSSFVYIAFQSMLLCGYV